MIICVYTRRLLYPNVENGDTLSVIFLVHLFAEMINNKEFFVILYITSSIDLIEMGKLLRSISTTTC